MYWYHWAAPIQPRHVPKDILHTRPKVRRRAVQRTRGMHVIQKAPLPFDRRLAGRTGRQVGFESDQFLVAQFVIEIQRNSQTILVTRLHGVTSSGGWGADFLQALKPRRNLSRPRSRRENTVPAGQCTILAISQKLRPSNLWRTMTSRYVRGLRSAE